MAALGFTPDEEGRVSVPQLSEAGVLPSSHSRTSSRAANSSVSPPGPQCGACTERMTLLGKHVQIPKRPRWLQTSEEAQPGVLSIPAWVVRKDLRAFVFSLYLICTCEASLLCGLQVRRTAGITVSSLWWAWCVPYWWSC